MCWGAGTFWNSPTFLIFCIYWILTLFEQENHLWTHVAYLVNNCCHIFAMILQCKFVSLPLYLYSVKIRWRSVVLSFSLSSSGAIISNSATSLHQLFIGQVASTYQHFEKRLLDTFNWAEGSKSCILCNVKRFPLPLCYFVLGQTVFVFSSGEPCSGFCWAGRPSPAPAGGNSSILEEWFREALKKWFFRNIS